jgi:hypothetical protein
LVIVRRTSVQGIYISAKTDDARLILKTKKKADLELVPLKRNPKRRQVLKVGSEPYDLAIFYYVDSPDYCCLSLKGMFISIPQESLDIVRLGFDKFEGMKDEKEKAHLDFIKKAGRERETQLKIETGCYSWDC